MLIQSPQLSADWMSAAMVQPHIVGGALQPVCDELHSSSLNVWKLKEVNVLNEKSYLGETMEELSAKYSTF